VPENGLVLDLPKKNPLLPKKFAIHKNVPTLLRQWPEGELWYMKDLTYKLPKACISAKIYTRDCNLGINSRG